MNIKSVTTAELSHREVARISSEVVTGLANSSWTAELVDTLVAKVTSAVVERLGKTGVDLTDVACHRVAAVVNERLEKTLAVNPFPETAYARLSDFIRDSVTVDVSEATTDCADIAIRVIRDQRQRLAEKDRRIHDAHADIYDAHADIYRAQERITDLQKQLAQKHDDCVTGEVATATASKLRNMEELVNRLIDDGIIDDALHANVCSLQAWIMSAHRTLRGNKP
jgi:hypothetical protein